MKDQGPRERSGCRPGQMRKDTGPKQPQPATVYLTEEEEARFRAWGIKPDPNYGRTPRRSSRVRNGDQADY